MSATAIADTKCDGTPKSQIENDQRFCGRAVVITGAGGQFGRAGCLYFARRGCRVAALDVVPDALRETHELLRQEIGSDLDFSAWACDVTSADAVREVVQQIVDRFGGDTIKYLWNNAGYQGMFAKTLDYDPKDFSRVMEINVTGQFIMLQAVARQMIKAGVKGCSIVNTASVAGMHCEQYSRIRGNAAEDNRILHVTVHVAGSAHCLFRVIFVVLFLLL